MGSKPAAGPGIGEHIVSSIAARLNQPRRPPGTQYPWVTLSYAQSLDGCIAEGPNVATRISNREALVLTHRLRALHETILVGVSTVLIDDPELTVRHAAGNDPVPIVLDSRLRTPPAARLLRGQRRRPVIATTEFADPENLKRVAAAGADVLRVPRNGAGQVDLRALLRLLGERGVRSIMIEGGARVITSVLREHLADLLVLTIAPSMLGGVRAVDSLGGLALHERPCLSNLHVENLDGTLVVHGEFERAGDGR